MQRLAAMQLLMMHARTAQQGRRRCMQNRISEQLQLQCHNSNASCSTVTGMKCTNACMQRRMLFRYGRYSRQHQCCGKGSLIARACTHCSLRAFASELARFSHALRSRNRPVSSHSRSHGLDTYSSKTQSQRRAPVPNTWRAYWHCLRRPQLCSLTCTHPSNEPWQLYASVLRRLW
jgi:hypothetical protein